MAGPKIGLIPEKIAETAATLHRRIRERFPDSGLSRIGASVAETSASAVKDANKIASPNMLLRIAIGLIILTALAGIVTFGISLAHRIRLDEMSRSELFESLNKGQGPAVFLGGALFFLITLEWRLKRRNVLAAVHRLRSLAHVIDMHQLVKTPDRVSAAGPDTASSPKRNLTPFQLARYLDYCTEMLAILSKVSHLYVQDLPDPQALEAVESLETLTTGLSRNIWQKIMILDERKGRAEDEEDRNVRSSPPSRN